MKLYVIKQRPNALDEAALGHYVQSQHHVDYSHCPFLSDYIMFIILR